MIVPHPGTRVNRGRRHADGTHVVTVSRDGEVVERVVQLTLLPSWVPPRKRRRVSSGQNPSHRPSGMA